MQSSCSQMVERMDEAPGPDVGLKTQCRQGGRPGHSKGLEVQEVWKGVWIDLVLANLMPTADG